MTPSQVVVGVPEWSRHTAWQRILPIVQEVGLFSIFQSPCTTEKLSYFLINKSMDPVPSNTGSCNFGGGARAFSSDQRECVRDHRQFFCIALASMSTCIWSAFFKVAKMAEVMVAARSEVEMVDAG